MAQDASRNRWVHVAGASRTEGLHLARGVAATRTREMCPLGATRRSEMHPLPASRTGEMHRRGATRNRLGGESHVEMHGWRATRVSRVAPRVSRVQLATRLAPFLLRLAPREVRLAARSSSTGGESHAAGGESHLVGARWPASRTSGARLAASSPSNLGGELELPPQQDERQGEPLAPHRAPLSSPQLTPHRCQARRRVGEGAPTCTPPPASMSATAGLFLSRCARALNPCAPLAPAPWRGSLQPC